MKLNLISGLCLLVLATCSDTAEEPSIVDSYMADPAAVARGRSIFVGTCSGYCHKLTNEPSDALFLFDTEWKHGGEDEEIFNTIVNGVPDTRMVGFGTAFPEGEDDIWKIIAFLRSN